MGGSDRDVQNSFYLYVVGVELLKCELYVSDDVSKMSFHALYSRFPQTTKVWYTLQDKNSGNSLGRSELRCDSWCFLMLEEFRKFLELTGSTNKVCSMIAPMREGVYTVTNNAMSKSSNECICGWIGDGLQSKSEL